MSTLLSTGSNARGQLASGDFEDLNKFSAASLPNDVAVLSIATGSNHTLVLSELATGAELQRQLWGAGDGICGQLGPSYKEEQLKDKSLGQTRFRPLSLPLQAMGLANYTTKLIAATWETSYIVLACKGSSDVILSMGSNDFGDLGTGTTGGTKNAGPHVVSFAHLPSPKGTSLSDGTFFIKQISAGQRHVVVVIECVDPIDQTGTEELLVGWGSSRHGQLGQQTKSPGSSLPPYIPLPTMIVFPQAECGLNDTIQLMALGMHHSVFLTTLGRLVSLGSNKKNQLDLAFNPPPGKFLSIGSTWHGTYAVVENDGAVLVFASGSNTHGQLGRGSIGQKIVGVDNVALQPHVGHGTSLQIACGTEHVLVLVSRHQSDDEARNTQELWAWGWNEHGNLGTSTTSDAANPVQVWSSTQKPLDGQLSLIKRVNNVWAGSGTSWIDGQITT
ncbi:regulator of chromosome condensation 1/beta-lactamase-inhibitor protein II [Panaeolus papilionaceus]|nr:regulator of chromosome condensation 1/beta-lactamase-inhibitor protein II [Panaeolus papilionaceus]